MKNVIIICEGQTEQEFCKDVLYPYFFKKGILIQYPTIKKSGGGIANWSNLKKQIENHLKEDKTAQVTTLIDFYGILKKNEFPCFEDTAASNAVKANNMEKGMKNDVDEKLKHRFIPYIQMHEFECFVFCSLNVLKANFKGSEADFKALEKVINNFPNPEDINNSPDTAPSKRLMQHISGYNKVVYGACLTGEIGLSAIREKCPRFNAWINALENVMM